MARILLLSSRVPYPLIAGDRIRIYHMGKILETKYQVDLLANDEHGSSEGHVDALRAVFNDVILFKFGLRALQWNALKHIVSRKPVQVMGYYLEEIHKWIRQNYLNYDLIYCNHVRMAEYVQDIEYPKVIDFHDAISMHYRSAIKQAKGFWKAWYLWEKNRLLSYELECLSKFDKAFIVSQIDKDYLLRNSNLKQPSVSHCPITVIPMGVKNEVLLRPIYEGEEQNWIVFLGKMNYYPNEDAAIYFAKEIFPLVKEKIKDLEFVIVGAYPTKRVFKLEKIKDVRVTGFVEDPYEYLERAKVVVAPMRFGAGIQDKILEAMALRKAVVTTPLGAQGNEGEDGKHFVVADGREETVEKTLELLKDEEKRKKIGENARALIEEKYTWDVIGEKLLKEIEEII